MNPPNAATAEKWQGNPPCASEWDRQIPAVQESADSVYPGKFDAKVCHDRAHLRTIAIPLRRGTAPSNLPRVAGNLFHAIAVYGRALTPDRKDRFFNPANTLAVSAFYSIPKEEVPPQPAAG